MRRKVEKSGLHGLMSRISVQGMRAVDKRSAGYRAMLTWRSELLRDLGGVDGLSAMERTLVELACRQKLFIDDVDSWLMRQNSLVNGKKKTLHAVVAQRNSLQNSLVNILDRLGLARREKRVGTLVDYLREREDHGNDEEHETGVDPGSDDGPEIIREDVQAETQFIRDTD